MNECDECDECIRFDTPLPTDTFEEYGMKITHKVLHYLNKDFSITVFKACLVLEG